jgi:hypothetical protein
MKLKVDRMWKKETYTIGKMYVNGKVFGDTIEDTDRGLRLTMKTAEIMAGKIYGRTAIPTGTYDVKLTYSPKFANNTWGKKYRGLVPEIMNVPAWKGVRIHPFNTAEESLGCIAVGKNSVKGKVLQSTQYYYNLMDKYILPAVKRGEKIELEIV